MEVGLLAAPFRTGLSAAYVPVVIEIGGRSLLEEHSEELLPLEIYAYATDADGKMTDFFSRVVGLELTNGAALAESGVKYYGHFELGPGDYRLRVLARNSFTGRAGVATHRLIVPSFSSGERFVLPPFLFDTRQDWLMLREQLSEDAQQRGSVVYPFTVEGAPYIPAARPSLRSGEGARVCLVVYNFAADEIEVESSVLDPSGSILEERVLANVERTVTGVADVDKIVASFEPPALDPGDYTLRIELIDPATGATEIETVDFRVVGS